MKSVVPKTRKEQRTQWHAKVKNIEDNDDNEYYIRYTYIPLWRHAAVTIHIKVPDSNGLGSSIQVISPDGGKLSGLLKQNSS